MEPLLPLQVFKFRKGLQASVLRLRLRLRERENRSLVLCVNARTVPVFATHKKERENYPLFCFFRIIFAC